MERSLLGNTIICTRTCKWLKEQTKVSDILKEFKLKNSNGQNTYVRDDKRWNKVWHSEIINKQRHKGRLFTKHDEIRKCTEFLHKKRKLGAKTEANGNTWERRMSQVEWYKLLLQLIDHFLMHQALRGSLLVVEERQALLGRRHQAVRSVSWQLLNVIPCQT